MRGRNFKPCDNNLYVLGPLTKYQIGSSASSTQVIQYDGLEVGRCPCQQKDRS